MWSGESASQRALAVCPIILLRVILRFCCRNAVMREQVPGCGSVNRPGWLASFSVSVDGICGQARTQSGWRVPGCGSVNRRGWLASFSVSVDETRPGADAIRTARAGLRQREQADLVRVHGHPPFLSMKCGRARTQVCGLWQCTRLNCFASFFVSVAEMRSGASANRILTTCQSFCFALSPVTGIRSGVSACRASAA